MYKEKIVAMLKLSRPFTLVAPAFGGFLFSLLAYIETGGDIWKIPLTAFILVMANYVSNVVNQIYDRDIDAINKPYRPIPSGKISVDEANSLAIILLIVTLSMSYVFMGVMFGLLLSIIMVFVWLYSSPPLRLRSRLFWSNLSLAAPRGALGIITAYSSYADPFQNIKLLIFSLGMAIYVFGGNTFKDFPDELGDKTFGVRNFVTVYGKKKALQISMFSIATSLIPFALTLGLYVLFLIGLVVMLFYFAYRNPNITVTENTVLWTLFYIGMVVGFVLFFMGEIFGN